MKKVGIFINSDQLVSRWQYNCILRLKDEKIVFFICNEDKAINSNKHYYINHLFYYIINILSIRTKKIKIDFSSFKDFSVKTILYKRNLDNWEEINSNSINDILEENPEFIYKCGMHLVRINDQLKDIPIISHHHGDPSKFRGRPSGFYEILKGEKKIGQIVQILSNKLDAGIILSYGETPVYNWSYRKTLQEAYRVSPLIFDKALKSLDLGIEINRKSDGFNYKLPSNNLCIYFIFKEIYKLISRIYYGLFFEKSWKVAYCNKFSIQDIYSPIGIFNYIDSLSNNFSTLSISRKYKFYADPFIFNSNIILEGLNKDTRKGDLLLIDIDSNSIIDKLSYENNHLSYPYTIKVLDKTFIYPDSGRLKNSIIIQKKKDVSQKKFYMNAFKIGLIDPSVLEHNGLFYLFANYPHEKCILRLWVSSDPFFNTLEEHPDSPVCISPFGGRSGGRIFRMEDKIFRFGQDLSGDYGNGLILFEISSLTRTNFSESIISSFKFKSTSKGPHNIDFSSNIITWDYYHEKLNLLAGLNRVLSKF